MKDLERLIRDIPDFPKPGIIFKDITPLLKDPGGFRATIENLEAEAKKIRPDAILGIESRGFVFGGALAMRLGCGFIPARKPGKLPYQTDRESYSLEYGTNSLEIHKDAVGPGQRILIVDDLLATGGTAAACARLVARQKGIVAGFLFVIELGFLDGRKQLGDIPTFSLIRYS